LTMQLSLHGAPGDLADPDPERDARASVAPRALADTRTIGEPCPQQVQRVLRLRALELLVATLDDDAPPAPRDVLVHLEADVRVRPHHRPLLPDDRVRVERLAVVGIDHRHDVRQAVYVTPDPADDLLAQERVDLLPSELEDPRAHRPCFAGRWPCGRGSGEPGGSPVRASRRRAVLI